MPGKVQAPGDPRLLILQGAMWSELLLFGHDLWDCAPLVYCSVSVHLWALTFFLCSRLRGELLLLEEVRTTDESERKWAWWHAGAPHCPHVKGALKKGPAHVRDLATW